MARYNGRIIVGVGGKQIQANWNETDTNSPAYIQNKPDISGALTRQVVNELPTENIDPNCIYMIPVDDHYDEYMYIDGNWEQIGSTQVEQVQSDWAESDPTSPAYIDNKPTALSDFDNDENFITLNDVPAQVQSDWNESDTTSPAYIDNKPTIPAAPVQSDWNESDTTSLAYIDNKPTIPTATSDLNNDSGYITINDVPAQVQSDWNETDNSEPSYIQNKPSLATVATTGDYTDLNNTPSIPTATSDLNNDSGYITINDVPAQVQADWNESDSSSPAYIDNKPTIPAAPVQSDWNVTDTTSLAYINNKPTIPTATSDLNNDSGYITLNDVPAQVQSDWNESDTSSPAYIDNKPTIPVLPQNIVTGLDKSYKIWAGNQVQYDALTPDPTTLYFIKEQSASTPFYFEDVSGSANSVRISGENNTVINDIELSSDGETWISPVAALSFVDIPVPANGKTYLRCSATSWFNGTSSAMASSATGDFKVGGNIMSLLYGSNFTGEETTFPTGSTYTFNALFFNNTHLIDASDLQLPATTLVEECYMSLFDGCTALTCAPALPATTLANYCYAMMFRGCSALTVIPLSLPATTLVSNCYANMFSNCTSLVKAPVLPATTLANGSYSQMFYGCSSLNYVKCLATDISATNCTSYWLGSVSATGTFVKKSAMAAWTTGVNGIPDGWDVESD